MNYSKEIRTKTFKAFMNASKGLKYVKGVYNQLDIICISRLITINKRLNK